MLQERCFNTVTAKNCLEDLQLKRAFSPMHLSSLKMIPRETIIQLHDKESNCDKSSLSNMF